MNSPKILPISETKELENIYAISRVVSQSVDWKSALDSIMPLARGIFIFDNLALYLLNPDNKILEATYARAVGRGRTSGEDIAWGEVVANQVLNTGQVIFQAPEQNGTNSERLKQPFLMGIPLKSITHILGVLVFVRFGGPEYSDEHTRIASYIASQITHLVEREQIKTKFDQMEAEQQQYRLQENFISTITHELLTPLGFIKGYTSTLLRSDTTWDANSQKEFLNIIDQETDRLQELIDNVLDSARLQSGTLRMEFQPVRLDALLKDVIVRARVNHRSLQVRLDIQAPLAPIQGDPRRLDQVFENLIGNCVKYAPGSPIYIKLRQENEHVKIDVQDNGPGISEKYLPHIFERFFRNPEQAPNIHGSGLGLYICRQIIQAHHGDIWIESKIGEGATVYILLPFSPAIEKKDQSLKPDLTKVD